MDDFFEDGNTEFVEMKDDAFLAVTTDKTEVYVGEGVNATLAFYISESNRAPLHFYELSRQLAEILKTLKPANCWEENFDIENIEGEHVTIKGKDYVQYKIYQAMFYPLNSQTIKFPSVSLEMLKFKMARNPSFFGQNSKEGYKTYKSQPKVVSVRELPPHPLKNTVAVGEYKLDERILDTNLKTGQSTSYEFNIYGEGNIASVPKPDNKSDDVLEIYEPSIQQDISRSNNRVTGTKKFRYFIIPKEPGQAKLSKYFSWVYFSPQRKQYDTLSSRLTAYITGESKKNEVIDSHDPGSFYDKIAVADNSLLIRRETNWQKWTFNGIVILVLAASVFLLFKK
jgi:hypothetical protein